MDGDGFKPADIEEIGPGRAIGMLQHHGKIQTPVEWHPDREESPTVPVMDGDQECAGCECLIDGYRHAPYLLVLAQMKRKYDTTYCQVCLERKHETSHGEADANEVIEA